MARSDCRRNQWLHVAGPTWVVAGLRVGGGGPTYERFFQGQDAGPHRVFTFHCECRGGRGEHTTQEDEQGNPSMMLRVLGTQERKNAGPGATEGGSVQPDQGGIWDSEQGAQARARYRAGHMLPHRLCHPKSRRCLLPNLPSPSPGTGSDWTDGGPVLIIPDTIKWPVGNIMLTGEPGRG